VWRAHVWRGSPGAWGRGGAEHGAGLVWQGDGGIRMRGDRTRVMSPAYWT